MGLRADGNLAVLPPRRHSGGARCAARRGPSRVAAGAAYRRGSVVELKHNRSQFHPPAFFPIGRNEPRVLRCFECSPGHSTDALARPSPCASCRRRITIARFAAAWSRDSADPKPVGNPDLAATSLFPAGVSSGISHRAGIVRDARVLGARYGAAHQPLRAYLQFFLLQRRLPR